MKNGKIYLFLISLTFSLFFFVGVLSAQTAPVSGEEELFNTTTDPDALLILDLSGSMAQNPTGGSNIYGNSSCSGTAFYSSSGSGHTTNCEKIEIAKRVLFNVLEDNGDSIINSSDRLSLGVRFGYMRYRNCSSSSEECTKAYAATSCDTADTANCSGATCGRTDGFCNNSISPTNFFANSSCTTADTTNCTGTGCSGGFCDATHSEAPGYTTHYASSSCATPDTVNCAGSGCSGGFCNTSIPGTPNYFASSSSCAADTTNCTGTGCSGGFCDVTHPKPSQTFYAHSSCTRSSTTYCPSSISGCSGGFCNSPQAPAAHKTTPDCQVACYNPGCNVTCYGGPGCTVGCTTAGCNLSCTSIGCTVSCIDAVTDSWTTGCNTLVAPIDTLYSCIYCQNQTSCTSTGNSTKNCTTNSNSIYNETPTGGTPLAVALNEANSYLVAHQAADTSRLCRKKFAILITDGQDTYACGGDGTETQSDMYKRRRESVAYAKKLADSGFKLFVIGFGQSMAADLQNTLNWMAYYGGTDNPNAANSGSVTGSHAYVIPSTSGSLFPSGVTSCMTSTTAVRNSFTVATANDPGDAVTYPLSGYAYFAADADALTAALKSAISTIRESTYSFTQASVQSSRTADENYLYEASFEPVAGEPFWHGHLKKLAILSDGTVGGMVSNGDAGVNLQTTNAADRNIKTLYGSNTLTNFKKSTDLSTPIPSIYFGYNTGNATADTAASDAVIGYIRGYSSDNPDYDDAGIFKLGDIFRSTPITVGTPSLYFNDNRDQKSSSDCTTLKTTTAFSDFRSDHCRASSCSILFGGQERRLIIAGANDGQLHAFKTKDVTEAWSFIPPNLLSKLKNITHSTNPTTESHDYYVDGQVTVADVWLGTGDGTCKAEADWKTLLIFGEGRGTNPNTWSASQYCDYNFNTTSKYSATYPYYCGYYALNVTDTLNPSFMWHINDSVGTNGAIQSSHGLYLGDAWSKVKTGKVRYQSGSGMVEKWVGFFGGGYNGGTCTTTTCGSSCDCRGRGFFVIDLSNGNILWSFTLGSTGLTSSPYMLYSLPSDVAITDTDNDGFIDTAYIGDLGGNMWRFKFCTAANTGCTIANWSGTRLFDGTSISPVQPVYVAPSVVKDTIGNLLVYWGTGDKNDPTNTTNTEKFLAVKDAGLSTAYTLGNLKNISPSIYCTDINANCTATQVSSDASKNGYYINLASGGEKVLADSVVFGGVVYFTTYTPPGGTSTDCSSNGTAYLYGLNYTTGAGVLGTGGTDRSVNIGTGIASAPVISMEPGSGVADLYVTVSGHGSGVGGGGTGCTGNTCKFLNPTGVANMTNILYWKDRRLE
jgi:Tfp pilus tip-associated adhesin PilY1